MIPSSRLQLGSVQAGWYLLARPDRGIPLTPRPRGPGQLPPGYHFDADSLGAPPANRLAMRWAGVDSNHRPTDYESAALTS
jgi:hypothetical protein